MLKQVTEKEFYDALYEDKRNIMPSIINEYEHGRRGYVSEWRAQGKLFGVTESGDFPHTEQKFFLQVENNE